MAMSASAFSIALDRSQRTGCGVHHAQRSDRLAVGGAQGNAGIEAHPAVAAHEGAVGEALVERHVGDLGDLGRADRLVAEGALARLLAGLGREAVRRLGPQAVAVDEVDRRQAGAAERGGKLGQLVEQRVARRVEHPVGVQRGEAGALAAAALRRRSCGQVGAHGGLAGHRVGG